MPSLRDAAGAGRTRDGHRARRRRRRRAGGRRGGRRQDRHDLFGRDGRRSRSGIAQARRLAEGFPRPQQDQGRRARTAWAPTAITRRSSPIPTTSSAVSRPARSARRSSPAAPCSSGCAPSADRGLRFSYGITSGNEISFDLADYLNFLVDDPEHQGDRAVHRGHPPARRVHGGGRRARSKPASRSSRSRPAPPRSRRPPRSRTPARSAATTPPISRCASATASTTAATSTT